MSLCPHTPSSTPSPAIRQRLFWADALRIVAAFAVVFLHVTAERISPIDAHDPEWWSIVVCRVLPSFAVPVFFMISGMFLLDPDRNVGKKKIVSACGRFIIAFAFWSAFYELAFSPHRLYLRQFLKGPVHLWFLPAIASCYLAAPALRAIARDREAEESLLAVVFLLLCVSSTLRALSNSFRRIIPTTIAILSVPAFLVLLGDYLHRFPPQGLLRRILLLAGGAGLLFSIVMTGTFAKEGCKADFILGAGHAPVVLFSMSVFLLFQRGISQEPSSVRFQRMVSDMAKYTFGIYLVHRAFIWILPAVPGPAFLDILIRTAASFSLSLAATAFILHIPLLRRTVA